jgi:hypothetical protein
MRRNFSTYLPNPTVATDADPDAPSSGGGGKPPETSVPSQQPTQADGQVGERAAESPVPDMDAEDAEILKMAVFKLRECASRLLALAGSMEAGDVRSRLANISATIDAHARDLSATNPVAPSAQHGADEAIPKDGDPKSAKS